MTFLTFKNSDGDKVVQMAMKNPDSYVVKEQREGEGERFETILIYLEYSQ